MKKSIITITAAFFVSALFLTSCNKEEVKKEKKEEEDKKTQNTVIKYTDGKGVIDIEGNTYKTVIINNQEWMAENLRTAKYANGDAITYMPIQPIWATIEEGAFCYYNNRTDNNEVYGKIYNGYVVSDSRNVCPNGWRVPTDNDWITLEKYVGLSEELLTQNRMRGTNQGEHLKSKRTEPEDHPRFCSPNNATNLTGFNALPSGSRLDNGYGQDLGVLAYFWSSTLDPFFNDKELYLTRILACNVGTIGRGARSKENGLCIRCIKN